MNEANQIEYKDGLCNLNGGEDLYPDARPSGGWFRRNVSRLLIFAMLLYVFITMLIGLNLSGSVSLMLVYFLTCLVCISLLLVCRKDLFSPIGLSVIWFFISFLLLIPWSASIREVAPEAEVPDSSLLVYTVSLSLLGLLCFALGTVCRLDRLIYPWLRWVLKSRGALRPVGQLEFFLLLGWIVLGSVVRLTINIDVAGLETDLGGNITGLLHYLFFTVTNALILLFLCRALPAGRIYLIQFLFLAGIFVGTQLRLGWRSGLKEILIPGFVVFWYQYLRPSMRRRSMIWIFALVLAMPTTMSIGNAMRTSRSGGVAQKFSEGGVRGFLVKLVTRLDGNSRFAGVLVHEMGGEGLSFANHFQMVELLKKRVSTANYADHEIWGIDVTFAHSRGASGPGGAYIALGILGIVLGYIFLGVLFQTVYRLCYSLSDSSLAVVLYGLMVVDLAKLYSENFSIIQLGKSYTFLLFVLLLVKQLYQRQSGSDALLRERHYG
ncbi:MAG: hypothetical protein GWP14_05750 [Actinobacteria bacterium]|nr:hypothetical protein [Actinomycetota bacterium]